MLIKLTTENLTPIYVETSNIQTIVSVIISVSKDTVQTVTRITMRDSVIVYVKETPEEIFEKVHPSITYHIPTNLSPR